VSSDEMWVVVPNWDRFQHYKDRVPTWIKVYTELAYSAQWRELPLQQRGLLVTLWLEFALSRGRVAYSRVRAITGLRNVDQSIKPLVDAGFVELSASKPLALTRSREKNLREEKKESAGASERAGDNSSRPRQEGAYRRAETMTRNVGWQYEPLDFLAELDRFDLDQDQRQQLEELRIALVNGSNPGLDW